MLESLDFHRYTGNIVEPNIVKSGFCCIQFTDGHKWLIVKSGIFLNQQTYICKIGVPLYIYEQIYVVAVHFTAICLVTMANLVK